MEIYSIFIDWKNIMKMSILLKEICRVNAIPGEIHVKFFIEIILKLVWEHKWFWTSKEFMRKKNKSGIIMLLISNYIMKL